MKFKRKLPRRTVQSASRKKSCRKRQRRRKKLTKKDQNQNQNQDQNKDKPQGDKEQPQGGISPQEREAMLEAIQAQEDKTQEKVKEKQGVVIFGNKNW